MQESFLEAMAHHTARPYEKTPRRAFSLVATHG
jgi:hypothetical protein